MLIKIKYSLYFIVNVKLKNIFNINLKKMLDKRFSPTILKICVTGE